MKWTKEISDSCKAKADELHEILEKQWKDVVIDRPFDIQPERSKREDTKPHGFKINMWGSDAVL